MKISSTALCSALAAFCLSLGTAGAPAAEPDHAHARLGKVHFPVECSAEAQQAFDTAVAYYHSFAWQHIGEPLDRALRADPSCGMAHWLRVLASLDNPFTWPGGDLASGACPRTHPAR